MNRRAARSARVAVLVGFAWQCAAAAPPPAAAGTGGGARAPRIASYVIDARLDVASRVLTGSEVLTWVNATSHAASELPFHLYFNAWRNSRSSFLRAAALTGRPIDLDDYGPDDWGYSEVTSVVLLPATEREARQQLETRFVRPDDGNPDDRTVLEARLPRPVPAGGSVRLEIQWRLKVPRPFARVGVLGEYYLMGQWFPKLGVLEPDGRWNGHQFIQTEFYSDFGSYDVRLTLPGGWVVGATGRRAPPELNPDGTFTHRFTAEDVHDFAWTASPHFTVHSDRFASPGLPPVDIELLLLPDHARLKDAYLSSARQALRLYGTWFRPYPWDRFTIVDPPSNSRTGGMEYPMFVTGESRWLTAPGNRLAEANTIHEVGHMWWQGAVANNEFEDAWLDESVNTYSHKRVLAQVYAPSVYEKRYFHDFIPVSWSDIPRAQPTHGADSLDGFRSPLKLESLATPSYRIDERAYYLLPYTKGALMLVTLERQLGWETWRKVLATFADRFWFRHPKPADFFAVANEVSGRDLTGFFEQVYAGTEVFDYAVDRVVSRPLRTPRGYADGGAAPAWQAGGAGGPDTAQVASSVDVRRWGGGIFPVEVRVTFEDGSVVEETWDGRARWTRFSYLRPAAVRTVEVDPRHVLVLDVNSSNNSWTRRPGASAAALKWTAKWAIWLQSLLESVAFFA